MDRHAAHDSFWSTSDVIFSIALFSGLGLNMFVPLPVTNSLASELRIGVGVVGIVAAVLFIVLAKIRFGVAGQPSAPGIPTTQVVDAGIYGHTRNPMYVGLLSLLPGLGLSFNVLWWLLLVVPMFFVFKYVLVVPEEEYLSVRFGDEYAAYMSRVRRWL